MEIWGNSSMKQSEIFYTERHLSAKIPQNNTILKEGVCNEAEFTKWKR
jgi:hypothetical protein